MRNKPLPGIMKNSPLKQDTASISDSVRRGGTVRSVEIVKKKKKTFNPGKNAPKRGKIYSPQQERVKAAMQSNPLSWLFT